MVVWFASQQSLGSGGFTRNTANDSTRATYQRLQTAEGLLWIAEALGADTSLVESASAEALSNPRRSRPRIIRQYIPWETIASLATAKKQSSELPFSAGGTVHVIHAMDARAEDLKRHLSPE